MTEFEVEPRLATRVTLEVNDGRDCWTPYPAAIVDLTREELWVSIESAIAQLIGPGAPVRLVLSHADRPQQTADTIVLWNVGRRGKVLALKRPRIWDPPSRREHMRVQLSIPIYIKTDDGEAIPSMSTNVSGGGIFCVAPIPLRVAQRVDVSIQLTPSQHFDCEAEVARISEDPDDPTGMQRLIGFHFLQLPKGRQAKLARAIATLAEDLDEQFVPGAWRPGGYDQVDLELDEPEAVVTAEVEQLDAFREAEANDAADERRLAS